MIFSGFSLLKLFGGFNIFNGVVLGKLLWNIAVTIVCLAVFWKIFLAPTNVTHQTGTITNVASCEDKAFVGIKFWFLKLGVSVK